LKNLLKQLGQRSNSSGPSERSEFYLHLIGSEKKLSLGPLIRVGAGPAGMLLSVRMPQQRTRLVSVHLSEEGAIGYGGDWYVEWFVSTEALSAKGELLEEPRTSHSLPSIREEPAQGT